MANQKSLSEEQQKRLAELFAAKVKVKDLATEFQVSTYTVYTWLDKLGIKKITKQGTRKPRQKKTSTGGGEMPNKFSTVVSGIKYTVFHEGGIEVLGVFVSDHEVAVSVRPL